MTGRGAFNLMLVAILGLFLGACLFVHPMADDFIYAGNARAGFWDAWLREYVGWNGRYASNAFLLAVPLKVGWFTGYRAAAALMLLSTVAAIYVFVRVWSGGGLTRQEALACGLTFSALYLCQAPSLGEVAYWYTSAATYHVPLIIALLHLTLIVRWIHRDHATVVDQLSLAFAFVLLAAVAGFNEVIMSMMLLLYGALVAWSLIERAPSRFLFGALFAFAGVCTLFVWLSPGNATRQSMFPDHHQLARSLGMSALQTLRFAGDWISSGSLLLATLLFVPICEKLSGRHQQGPRLTKLWFLLLVAGLVLVVPVSTFPAYWETGILGQHRTVNVAYFAFLILWFLATSMWLASGHRLASSLKSLCRDWRLPVAVLLIASLALTRNSYALELDLISGRLAEFNRGMRGRYAALLACQERGQRSCDIDALRSKPASFYVLDVSSDPTDWVNVSYARYFGVSEVRLKNGGHP